MMSPIQRTVLSAVSKPPEGFEKVEGSKNRAYRKAKPGGGYEYWYPSKKHAARDIRHHTEKAFHHAHMHGLGKGLAKDAKTADDKKHFATKAGEHEALSNHHREIVDGAHDFYYAGKHSIRG